MAVRVRVGGLFAEAEKEITLCSGSFQGVAGKYLFDGV